jgi:hypothetical protein
MHRAALHRTPALEKTGRLFVMAGLDPASHVFE